LIEVLLAIGGRDGLFIENLDLIDSVDINPLFLNADRAVAADARIVLRRESAPALDPPTVPADFSALFEPQSIAVAGASATRLTFGNVFIKRLREYGYEGAIYPDPPAGPGHRRAADVQEPWGDATTHRLRVHCRPARPGAGPHCWGERARSVCSDHHQRVRRGGRGPRPAAPPGRGVGRFRSSSSRPEALSARTRRVAT